ncbi:APC family permease [Streptomyces abyssomicinicus]|uniref:APC family permease n=1 Tax=Streptomyces abyssomicinicus TaxID=574929 RepID=UPI00124FFFE3|nr:amino acid permease [Streptomyces abyssomicinicus]
MPQHNPSSAGRLTVAQGTALSVGAVLGTGVIALPALAADIAGPASLLAWIALVVLSVPLAAAFAALGARHADAGGVSTYARLAFGERTATVAGWCFYLAIPPGATVAALFGGSYFSAALGGGTATTVGTAVALMATVTVVNATGVRLTGRLQVILFALLLTLLTVAVLFSLPHATTANLRPFAPHGWSAIGPAAALLVFCFAGWEAVAHLAGEFRRPDRDLPRATAAAVVIVGIVYLAAAFAVITVLGPSAARSGAPLGDLMAKGLGDGARPLAAVAALLLTFGTMNAYYAGAAKLGAALGRDGALPRWFARGSTAGETPRRSLFFVSALALLTLLAVGTSGTGAQPAVMLSAASFSVVYAIGVAAAIRLLPRDSWGRRSAWSALTAVLALLALSGSYLVWPLLVSCAALLSVRVTRRRRTKSDMTLVTAT